MTIHHSENLPDVVHRPTGNPATGNRSNAAANSPDVFDFARALSNQLSSAISGTVAAVASAAHHAAVSVHNPEQRFIFNTMMMGKCTERSIAKSRELQQELFYLQNPAYDPYLFSRKVTASVNQDSVADRKARSGANKTQYQKDLEYLVNNPIPNMVYIYWTEFHREPHELAITRAKIAAVIFVAAGEARVQPREKNPDLVPFPRN